MRPGIATAINCCAMLTSAAGIGQGIDKTNGKVKLTHDPIAALGWQKMTMFFRLKKRALADRVQASAKAGFFLEKAASGCVVSGLRKSAAEPDAKRTK